MFKVKTYVLYCSIKYTSFVYFCFKQTLVSEKSIKISNINLVLVYNESYLKQLVSGCSIYLVLLSISKKES